MGIEIPTLINLAPAAKTLFYLSLIPLFIYSIRFYIFGISGPIINMRRKHYADVPTKDLPKISVHIPVYNDPIVKQCIDHCLKFDYPKSKFEILVADDSTDRTVQILDEYRDNDMVKVVRRDSRVGFKAGALNNLIPHSKGDIIVVFDSDYTPSTDFLKKIVRPFHSNKKIAYVQSRWGYTNPSDNVVSRVASMCFNSFHKCCMPLHNKIGSGIFCGTGGAVRADVLNEVGGWNEKTVSEDLDVSIRILQKGYMQEYMPDLIAAGEVPTTLKAFVKQQQRWAYGTTKAFIDYIDSILISKKMNLMQKLDFSLLLPAFFVFPFILGVFVSSFISSSPLFGAAGYIPTTLVEAGYIIHDIGAALFGRQGLIILLGTSGFFYTVIVGLIMDKKYKEILFVPAIYLIGLVIQITNTISVFKAILGVPVTFYRTPKKGG